MPVSLTKPGIEWIPDGSYELGKFDTLRDEYLYEIWMDGADETSGDVDAPTGCFALIIITADDIPNLRASYGRPVEGIIGNFIMRNNSQGFVWAESYETEAEARTWFEELDGIYGEWLDDNDDDAL